MPQAGEAYAVAFSAKNIDMDAFAGSHGLSLDSFDFKGVASIGERQLVVDDLVMMSGNTAVRLRASSSAARKRSGCTWPAGCATCRTDAQASLAQSPWRRARPGWRMLPAGGSPRASSDRLAGDMLAAAFRRVPIPDEMVDMRFTAENVAGTYFKLPPVSGVSLKARLRGNAFAVDDGRRGDPAIGEAARRQERVVRARDCAPTVTPAALPSRLRPRLRRSRSAIDSRQRAGDQARLDGVQLNGNATVKFELDAQLGQAFRQNRIFAP